MRNAPDAARRPAARMTPHRKAAPPPVLVRNPDAAALAALDALTFGVSWTAAEYASLLANPASGAWLVREGRWDIGYLVYQRVDHEAEIHRIGVVPTWRGRGHGRRLLDGFLDWARRHRVSRVYLEVREGNLPAVSLYEQCGFRVGGRRRGYFTAPPEDALIMECRLAVKPLKRILTENLGPPRPRIAPLRQRPQ